MSGNFTVAIDGPAGAGKSTVAKKVARRLGFLYVDTGAMYRAVTYMAIRKRIDLNDLNALHELARTLNIKLVPDQDNETRVFVNQDEITREIREPEISRNVSLVARVPGVRREMVQRQREMAAAGNVVMEGRDIGTAVLPQADLKFYITASPRERAKRRAAELLAKGYQVDLEQLALEIAERDRIDSTREVDPLKPAPDAEIIDCSDMDVEQVSNMIVERVTGRMN